MNATDLILFSGKKSCYFDLTEAGKKCKMLRFLINTCNYWKDKKQLSEEETLIRNRNLLSRLCAIGYLAVPFKEEGNKRIVVATDNGQGCCGKSLLGDFLSNFIPSQRVSGRQCKHVMLKIDVSLRTRLLYIDDANEKEIKTLFPLLSDDWTIKKMWKGEEIIPHAISPKMYASHSGYKELNSLDNSMTWMIFFSDYYSCKHSIADDFELLMDNDNSQDAKLNQMLINDCIKLYLEFGFVEGISYEP